MPRNSLSLVLIAMALGACGPADAPEQGERVIYRHSMDGVPGSLDPARASSVYNKFLAVNLFDTLYRYRYLARPYALAPNLALELPQVSEDGLVYTIRLKKGVRFVDDPAFPAGIGREVTAQDFIYSIQRHFDPGTLAEGAWLWQGRIVGLDDWKAAGSDYAQTVPGLRALDNHTVRVELTAPFPQFTHTLAQGYAAIVPREAVDHYGKGFSNQPVGSGPFTLASIDSARAVLLRNPNYHGDAFALDAEGFDPKRHDGLGLQQLSGRRPPFVDEVIIEFITEDASRWNALVSGDAHLIKVPAGQFDQVLEKRQPLTLKPEFTERFRYDASLESGFVYTNFNMADERIGYHPDPEQDVRNRALRCAMVKAFDWGRRNASFYSGIGRIFPGIITPGVPEFDAEANHEYVRHDLEGAKRLLARFGWNATNLPVLEYGFPASVTERQMFEQFRGFMVELGFPPERVQPLTFASFADYYRAYSNREVMLITSSWTMDYPDAENTMQLFFGLNQSPGSNSSNYSNPRFDELYRSSATLAPSEARTEMFREMNQQVIEDCASITGISRTLLFMWDRDLVMVPDRSFVGGFYLRFVDFDRAAEDQQ
ncbi:MAG: ABC transporter substrate-binding protein [Lysobacterales bacterium]